MKKISLFLLTIAVLSGAVYFSGIDLSFLGLRSAILSEENCDSSLLLANKAEYTKSVADLVVINNYITLNACEGNGFGKTNFEIAACERKIALKKNKTDFVNGYAACQASVDAGPNIRLGSVTNATLIEQSEGESTHFNEGVYTLTIRAQGEAYVRELVYELTLPLTNNELGVTITKADLSSSKTGTYACAQTLAPTQPDPTKQVILITCRSTDGGYQVGLNGDTTPFTTKLNLYVSTINSTGSGALKFLSGKYALERMGGEEKPFTKISSTVQPGTVSYTMAYVDTRELTAEIVAQDNTSSPTIPVQVVFNKLIHIPSISFSSTDFVLSNNVNASNYKCFNTPDNEGNLRTICSFDLTPKNQAVAADITVDFPAGAAQDKTRPTPKTNSAAARKTIHYVYGAPTIFVGAPCGEAGGTFCSGIDNTPQLIARAAVGDIPANTSVKLYRNGNCDISDLVQTLTTTRNMPKVDLYENKSLEKNESRIYSVKVGNNCSSGRPTASGKQAEYQYTGETYAQVDRLSCMNPLIIQPTQLPVSPYIANNVSLCDAVDLVDAKKCNAWQGNATFNPECFPTGQGTIQNPYRICTAEQLQEMDNGTYDKKHYRLGRSIDLTNSASWFGGKGFSPIGRAIAHGFSGSLDGNGFEIQNLTVKSPEDYVGLFGAAQGGSYAGVWIHNLKLSNVLIENPGNISGSLAGTLGCAVVDGVEVSNMNMQGVRNNSGGIAGYTWYETKILYSKAQGSITTADTAPISAVGGIIGITPGGPLELAHTESDVSISAKASAVGGLVGHLYGGPTAYLNVHDNVVKGSILARASAIISGIGGILGNATYVHAENNISDAGNNQITIEGSEVANNIGGFVGQAGNCELVHNSTTYGIQGATAGYTGGFGGSISGGITSKNSSSGAIGGDNSKGPQGMLIGGFVGSANFGKFFDNYSTSEIYLSQDAGAAYVGGFAGGVGGSELRRNYSTGNILVNHINDYYIGGFTGPISKYAAIPYTLTDNFSTGRYIDTVGIGSVLPDYYGGFVAAVTKTSDDVFENNFFYNATVNTCTGKISYDKPVCTSVASKSAFYAPTQGVYTRSDNSWDFVNTWRELTGGLPVLR